MRKGNRFLSDRSIVMQNQTTRCGNGTMTVFVLIGLIGFPALARRVRSSSSRTIPVAAPASC